MVIKTKAKIKIGPQHQGRRMSLRAFEFAEVEDGHLYELARGVIVVAEVPNFFHGAQSDLIQDYLRAHKVNHPGSNYRIAANMDGKLVVAALESERHPDIAVYLTKPTGPKDRTVWRRWIPELLIEIVSPSSVDRDYVEKREEYWELGVQEYWIVDSNFKKVLILRRGRKDWIETELHAGDVCETKLLPGFQLPCDAVFEVAGNGEEE
jgi:Uma2 family endonuclease